VDISPTPAWYLGTGEHRKIDAEAASVDQSAQSPSKRTDRRCDPTDPDGKRGASNVAEPKVDMCPVITHGVDWGCGVQALTVFRIVPNADISGLSLAVSTTVRTAASP
jgi:hypothetical protein